MYYNTRYKRRDRTNAGFRPLQVDIRYTGDTQEQRDADLEKGISKFKKLLMKEGIPQELRDREYFKSPGQKIYEKRKKFLYKLNQKREKVQKRYSKNKDR